MQMRMKKATCLLASSALALTLSAPAFSQDMGSDQGMSGTQGGMSQGGTSGAMTQGGGAQAQAPDMNKEYTADNLIGMQVQNLQGQDLGSISNLVIDPNGQVSHVVLSRGGIAGVGAEKYAVPFDRVQLQKGQNVARIDVSQDQLSSEFAAFEEQPAESQESPAQQGQESPSSAPSSGGTSSDSMTQ